VNFFSIPVHKWRNPRTDQHFVLISSGREERSIVWGILVLHTQQQQQINSKKARGTAFSLGRFPKEVVVHQEAKPATARGRGRAAKPNLIIPFPRFVFAQSQKPVLRAHRR